MATFTIKEEAYIKYQLTTYQGTVEMDGEEVTYRFSADDNGEEFYIFNEDTGYERIEFYGEANEKYAPLLAAIGEWGNPEDMGPAGEVIEIDDEIVEDYL